MTILDWVLKAARTGVTLPEAGAATSSGLSSYRPAGGDVSAERRKEGRPDSPNKRRTCPPNAFTEAVKRGGPAGIDAAIHAVHESNPANLGFCSPDVKRTSTIIEFHRSTQCYSIVFQIYVGGNNYVQNDVEGAVGGIGAYGVVEDERFGFAGENGEGPLVRGLLGVSGDGLMLSDCRDALIPRAQGGDQRG